MQTVVIVEMTHSVIGYPLGDTHWRCDGSVGGKVAGNPSRNVASRSSVTAATWRAAQA